MYITLGDIFFILFLVVVFTQFWRIRAITEAANKYASYYCEKNNLQLISVARFKTRFGLVQGKPNWKADFAFEFSGNGEDKYQGVISMEGLKVKSADIPPYRVN